MVRLGRDILVMMLLAPLFVFIGCTRAYVDVPNPLPIAEAEYNRVFDASVEILREMRFVVNRQDRRFGVVTTHPLDASSSVEPWHPDNVNTDDTFEATLNHHRRTVRVMLGPRQDEGIDETPGAVSTGDSDEAEPADARPAPRSGSKADYGLYVEVQVERRHHPGLNLTSAAFAAVGFRGRAGAVMLTETGVEASHWEPMGRDPFLEREIVARIIRRSVHISDERAVTDPVSIQLKPADPHGSDGTDVQAGPA